jgi:hypothetical protein
MRRTQFGLVTLGETDAMFVVKISFRSRIVNTVSRVGVYEFCHFLSVSVSQGRLHHGFVLEHHNIDLIHRNIHSRSMAKLTIVFPMQFIDVSSVEVSSNACIHTLTKLSC